MDHPFFFSYAHNDLSVDANVLEFFKEVSRQVRAVTGSKVDGFRDEEGLRAGDEWSKKLVAELRKSPAMVSLYSPSYFQSTVCAQEMQVFLERRAKYKRELTGSPPASIIPVLWVPETIPVSVPDFQYEKPNSTDQGLAFVGQFGGDPAEFKRVAWRVAVRVKEARKTPLPDLGFDPVLGGLESAFDPPPLPPRDVEATTENNGPECVTYVYANTPSWQAWPFVPAAKALLHMSAAVAKGRELHVHQLAFDPGHGGLLQRIENVRNRNHVVICLVDGSRLADATLIDRLREYDSGDLDSCGTIVVWPSGTRTAAAEAALNDAFPKQRQRQPPYFYPSIDAPGQFLDAVARSLDALRNDCLRNPRGVAALPSSSFATVPGVEVPGRRIA